MCVATTCTLVYTACCSAGRHEHLKKEGVKFVLTSTLERNSDTSDHQLDKSATDLFGVEN